MWARTRTSRASSGCWRGAPADPRGSVPLQRHRVASAILSRVVTCKADPSIQRVARGTFQFPLGAYPVEDLSPKAGYSVHFEPADGDDGSGEGENGEWEEWPDRYV